MDLSKHVSMFRLLLLPVGLTQVLNSLRSQKKSDHNAVKFSYELNFEHSQFFSHLYTIPSQGLLHFTSHRLHFNHDSRNIFFIKSQLTEHKTTRSQRTLAQLLIVSYLIFFQKASL